MMKKLKALYALAGYPSPWLSAEQAKKLEKLNLLIVQDILPSPATAVAKYVLPGGSFAEKEGTFVNVNLLAQGIKRAINGPGESRPDGRIFMELLERRGLFHAPTLRQEIAREIAYFAPLGRGDLGAFGVFLGKNAPAGTPAPQSSALAGS